MIIPIPWLLGINRSIDNPLPNIPIPRLQAPVFFIWNINIKINIELFINEMDKRKLLVEFERAKVAMGKPQFVIE